MYVVVELLENLDRQQWIVEDQTPHLTPKSSTPTLIPISTTQNAVIEQLSVIRVPVYKYNFYCYYVPTLFSCGLVLCIKQYLMCYNYFIWYCRYIAFAMNHLRVQCKL